MTLSSDEKELISKEIENLEKLSSCELVAVVTKRSDSYKLAAAMVAIFNLFCISVFFVFFSEKAVFQILQIQFLVFIGSYLLLNKFKKVFLKILPKSYKYQISSENANRQFYNLQLDKTKTKHAIMFFVSFDEKYVEIITDNVISKEIPNSHWQLIVDEFIDDVKQNQLFDGYIKAIKACNAILIEKFPIKKDDINELSNEVIELK